MSVFTARPALRWLVPLAVVATAVGGSAIVRTVAATAGEPLPPRSAAQLLTDVQQAKLDGLSGTIVERADLGLPALPVSGGGGFNLASLATGSHTMRVWYSGPDKLRLALIGNLGETDMVKSGSDIWTWDSDKNKATHSRITPDTTRPSSPSPTPTLPQTPQDAAAAVLAAVEPSTVVTATQQPVRVAGRSAYELVLEPRDTGSLVAAVRVAIDGKQHVPLRVRVFAKGSDAAVFETAFTAVNFRRPEASQFVFTAPHGATVQEEKTNTPTRPAPATGGAAVETPPTLIGTGWTSIAMIRIPADQLEALNTPGAKGMPFSLDSLPKVSGPWGSGHVLRTKLCTLLLTTDGRLYVGAVTADRLTAAAAKPVAGK